VATKTFNRPGNYSVTFTATNNGASDSESCVVNVVPPPAPPEIIGIDASETRFEVCEPVEVEFEANVRGTEPITYTWDFGDGTTGSGEEVEHTFSEPGTYTVRLTARNADGESTRTITITAEPCTAGICYDITEMNSVFFGRNSSTLTNEARTALQENLDIFRECPNLCARIVGYAGPDERNPQQLSEDRARAVEQFYVDNNIAASRFSTEGRGVLPGTTKKEGAAQARRVDTLPVQCVDLSR
jgi:outer membrane protein OmpA-like peptidoglycan-associated protein